MSQAGCPDGESYDTDLFVTDFCVSSKARLIFHAVFSAIYGVIALAILFAAVYTAAKKRLKQGSLIVLMFFMYTSMYFNCLGMLFDWQSVPTIGLAGFGVFGMGTVTLLQAVWSSHILDNFATLKHKTNAPVFRMLNFLFTVNVVLLVGLSEGWGRFQPDYPATYNRINGLFLTWIGVCSMASFYCILSIGWEIEAYFKTNVATGGRTDEVSRRIRFYTRFMGLIIGMGGLVCTICGLVPLIRGDFPGWFWIYQAVMLLGACIVLPIFYVFAKTTRSHDGSGASALFDRFLKCCGIHTTVHANVKSDQIAEAKPSPIKRDSRVNTSELEHHVEVSLELEAKLEAVPETGFWNPNTQEYMRSEVLELTPGMVALGITEQRP